MMIRIKTMLTALVALGVTVTAQAKVAVGASAPDFTLPAATGEHVSLSDYKGKYVILEWTNHDCPFVKKHYESGNMQAIQKTQTSDGVIWLSIISSAKGKQGNVSAAKATSLSKQRKASPSHVLLDESGQVGQRYGAKTTPHMYIINPQGVLEYMGAIDSIKSTKAKDIPKAINYVTLAMNELKAGKSLSYNKTRPYGCSVKY